MRHKNPHVLLFGPSDDDGQLSVLCDELIAQAEEEIRLAPMDFLHPVDEFDGNIAVTPLDAKRIQAALDAHATWSSVSPYPPGYRDALEEALQRIAVMGDGEISVNVSAG